VSICPHTDWTRPECRRLRHSVTVQLWDDQRSELLLHRRRPEAASEIRLAPRPAVSYIQSSATRVTSASRCLANRKRWQRRDSRLTAPPRPSDVQTGCKWQAGLISLIARVAGRRARCRLLISFRRGRHGRRRRRRSRFADTLRQTNDTE